MESGLKNRLRLWLRSERALGLGASVTAPPPGATRVLEAIASLTKRPSYVVLDKGLDPNELSCIMVVSGAFFGMGYLPKDFTSISHDAIKDYIKPYKENSYIRNLLNSHRNNFPDQVRLFDS